MKKQNIGDVCVFVGGESGGIFIRKRREHCWPSVERNTKISYYVNWATWAACTVRAYIKGLVYTRVFLWNIGSVKKYSLETFCFWPYPLSRKSEMWYFCASANCNLSISLIIYWQSYTWKKSDPSIFPTFWIGAKLKFTVELSLDNWSW